MSELATEILTLPLFVLEHDLAQRDMEQPNALIHINLNENLMAELCQNPAIDSTTCIYVDKFQFEGFDDLLLDSQQPANIEIHLKRGPILSVVCSLLNEQILVSPEIEFMPEFDLGSDDDIEEQDD